MSKKHRREPRVDHRMPITVHYGNGAQLYQTENVAYRGIFLETPDPLQLHKLVKLTLDLEEHTVEFLAVVARRVNRYDADEEHRTPGMGLAIYSVGDKDARMWEEFVHRLYNMDPEARRELEAKQLTKLHLIVDSGEALGEMIERAIAENHIDYHSQRALEIGGKHLLTITHAVDHSLRANLTVEIQHCPDAVEEIAPSLYRLAILDPASQRDESLRALQVGEHN